MPNFIPATINLAQVPRGSGNQQAGTFVAQSMTASFAWGTQPGTATIVYIPPNPAWTIVTGALCELQIGGHLFFGICKSDVANKGSSEGLTRTLQFMDLRDFLSWDYVWCVFNKPDVVLINGVRTKRYKHIYPADFATRTWTYDNTPLQAWEILAAILNFRASGLPGGVTGGTIGSPWAWDLTGQGLFPGGVMNYPIYDYDCEGGKRIDAVLNDFCERLGCVVGLLSTQEFPYLLVFTRKGYGTSPVFPDNSDNRRSGVSLSGNATNVRIVGDRNAYQMQDIVMQNDWARAWEQFMVFELFADYVYHQINDPKTGNPYSATPSDPEGYIGRQLASARALTITVGEFVSILGGMTGAQFADYRKFNGRWRMDMPAALYISTILWRAFKPADSFAFSNAAPVSDPTAGLAAGSAVPLQSLDIAPRLLCKVSQSDPTSGTTQFDVTTPTDGNGYAIARGYMVGSDLFKMIRSDQFSLNFFNNATSIWQHVPFEIDDSGEGVRFIIFEEPVITSENLVTQTNGHCVVNASATLNVPSVKATLTFEAERFSYWKGTFPDVSRDTVENVGGLNLECVIGTDTSYTEVDYADGSGAYSKADLIAQAVLVRQYVLGEGGYKFIWQPNTPITSFGTALSSMVDRVQITTSPREGTYEVVDLANERQRDHFEPERELERRTQGNSLFPGQAELRIQAEYARKLAAAFRELPGLGTRLGKLLSGQIGSEEELEVTWVRGTPGAGTLPVGTVIRKPGTTIGSPNTNTAATDPRSMTSADNVFMGVTVLDNVDVTRPFRIQRNGRALALVQGPVAVGDSVGISATNSYLVKNGSPSVGNAQQVISDTSTKLIEVFLGGAGGGTAESWYKGTWDPAYNSGSGYSLGDGVRVLTGGVGGAPPNQGWWISKKNNNTDPPTFPEPVTTGGVNSWDMISFGVQASTDCQAGTNVFIYTQSSAPI